MVVTENMKMIRYQLESGQKQQFPDQERCHDELFAINMNMD